MFKHLPNILTLIRVPLAGIFLYLLVQPGLDSKIQALLVFVIAAITDYFDGYLARKYHLYSNFGKLMDPITDKVLTLCAFGIFAWMHLFPLWMFWVVAGREVGITIFRLWAKGRGLVLAAETAGKWKTTLQMVVIIGVLIFLILNESGWIVSSGTALIWIKGIFIGMLAVVVLTLQSGLSVVGNSLAQVQRAKKARRFPKFLAKFLATGAYIGYTPKLPGTMTTFVICLLMVFWQPTLRAHILAFVAVMILGWIVCGIMEEETGRKDPGFIVIDEVAGVLAAFLFLPMVNLQVAVAVFILFRYFDIKKVLGIRQLEAAGGSAGVMLDDILAGVYTNAVMQILLLSFR